MDDHHSHHARIRHTTVGALAALASVGAIAAAGAIAGTNAPGSSKPPVQVTGPAPSVPQALQDAVQHLVNSSTITAAQAQTLDNDIKAGTVHPDQLASQGFTQAQSDAIQQALRGAKVRLAKGSRSPAGTPAARRHHHRRHSHPGHRHS